MPICQLGQTEFAKDKEIGFWKLEKKWRVEILENSFEMADKNVFERICEKMLGQPTKDKVRVPWSINVLY